MSRKEREPGPACLSSPRISSRCRNDQRNVATKFLLVKSFQMSTHEDTQDKDPRWDDDARRDRDHQGDHDKIRRPYPDPRRDGRDKNDKSKKDRHGSRSKGSSSKRPLNQEYSSTREPAHAGHWTSTHTYGATYESGDKTTGYTLPYQYDPYETLVQENSAQAQAYDISYYQPNERQEETSYSNYNQHSEQQEYPGGPSFDDTSTTRYYH